MSLHYRLIGDFGSRRWYGVRLRKSLDGVGREEGGTSDKHDKRWGAVDYRDDRGADGIIHVKAVYYLVVVV
jgi:hypothetical protein